MVKTKKCEHYGDMTELKTLTPAQELERLLIDIDAKLDKVEQNLDILGPAVTRIEQLLRDLFKPRRP